MLDSKCIYGKGIFAKCTRLACLLSFASLFFFFYVSRKCLNENCFLRTKKQNTMGSVSLKSCCSGRMVAVGCVWTSLDDQHSSRVHQMAAHAQKLPATANLHKTSCCQQCWRVQILSSWESPGGSVTCLHQCSAVSNPTTATIARKIHCRN